MTDVSPPGQTMVTVDWSTRPGRYSETLPSAYDARTPLPLVLDLHGYQETLEVQQLMSNLPASAEQHGFIVVEPQIDNIVPRWDPTVGSPDVTFVEDVLDRVLAQHCIDQAGVYVDGLSHGAFMTSVIACQLSDRVAAVATVAGIRDPADCRFTRPMPVIAFHGTADSYVAYEGGYGPSVANLATDDGGTIGSAATALPTGPSIEEIAAAWAARNGCASPTPTETGVAEDVALLEFGCPSASEVELYRIDGGGHAWPGSQFSASVESFLGPTTFSVDATELIWSFFAAHSLPG